MIYYCWYFLQLNERRKKTAYSAVGWWIYGILHSTLRWVESFRKLKAAKHDIMLKHFHVILFKHTNIVPSLPSSHSHRRDAEEGEKSLCFLWMYWKICSRALCWVKNIMLSNNKFFFFFFFFQLVKKNRINKFSCDQNSIYII